MHSDQIGEALQELYSWVKNWDVAFLEDPEWPDTRKKVEAALADRGMAVGGVICKSHGLAVLTTHVNDGEPCTDFLLAERKKTQ
jgi:hypothetical protein